MTSEAAQEPRNIQPSGATVPTIKPWRRTGAALFEFSVFDCAHYPSARGPVSSWCLSRAVSAFKPLSMAMPMKPGKAGVEEATEEVHRIPITLSSKNVTNLEKEVARDEWMTKLPPERQAGGPPAHHNTFFSKSGRSGRGDTSTWTDTPAAKAEKAKMQYLEAYKQGALTNGPADEFEEREKERATEEAQLMDSYNSHKRSQSLLEKHMAQRAASGKKKSKKAEKSAGVGAGGGSEKEPDWKVNHPWKPWDRENDLGAGRTSVNLDPKNLKEALSSRFGGSSDNEPRKFL